MNLEKLTHEVVEIAKKAGGFIRDEAARFDRERVESKGKNDLVSYVDKESERQLIVQLGNLLPEAKFISEEETVEQGKGTYTWIIDPLDGTTNFVHGMTAYAVSIGLLEGDTLIVGVVYEINFDEAFYAWKNGGCYLNGKQITVSSSTEIKDCLFATGFPVQNFSRIEEYLAVLHDLMEGSHGIRRLGSAATDLAYVACGRCDGFFEYNLNPWDVAAGILLVKEAGGEVSDFSGQDNALFGRQLVAGGGVYPNLLRIIQKRW